MKIIKLIIICFVIILSACSDNSTTTNVRTYTYLNNDSTIYSKGDTLIIDNRKFVKVYGVTHCKYGCPVLIECK